MKVCLEEAWKQLKNIEEAVNTHKELGINVNTKRCTSEQKKLLKEWGKEYWEEEVPKLIKEIDVDNFEGYEDFINWVKPNWETLENTILEHRDYSKKQGENIVFNSLSFNINEALEIYLAAFEQARENDTKGEEELQQIFKHNQSRDNWNDYRDINNQSTWDDIYNWNPDYYDSKDY